MLVNNATSVLQGVTHRSMPRLWKRKYMPGLSGKIEEFEKRKAEDMWKEQ